SDPPPSILAPAIRPVTLPVPSRADMGRRLAAGLRSAARHMPRAVRTRNRADRITAIRLVFEDLGGTFTKFGQLFGSAPSLFGEDVAREFRSFLDASPPVP